jgi:histone-lysine N-methyltransferase SETMAR
MTVSVEDDERSGRPSTSKTTENVEKIRELIHEGCRRTIHEVADTVGISYGVCQAILTENMNMRHIAAKFVPRLLSNDQKQRRVNMCLELREKANEDPTFISRITTGDESWIYGYEYDPETKQQLSLWKSPQSPRAKKARQVRSSTNSMLIFSMGRGLFTVNLFLLK